MIRTLLIKKKTTMKNKKIWCDYCHEEITDEEAYVVFQNNRYHEDSCWTNIKNTMILDEEL